MERFECETICVRKMEEEEEGRRSLIVVARACNLTVVCHFCKRIVCHLSRITFISTKMCNEAFTFSKCTLCIVHSLLAVISVHTFFAPVSTNTLHFNVTL